MGLTSDDLEDPIRRAFAAVLLRAVNDATGRTWRVPEAQAMAVRIEAYEWLQGDEAPVYAAMAGIPVAKFLRHRAQFPDPRVKEDAA